MVHTRREIGDAPPHLRGTGPAWPRAALLLLPQAVPAWTSRADDFDAVVIDSLAEIDALWHDQLRELNIAVDDVPRMLPIDPGSVQWPAEVSADRSGSARAAHPRRHRPRRQPDTGPDRGLPPPVGDPLHRPRRPADLVREVLIEQVATYLGLDEDTIENGPS